MISMCGYAVPPSQGCPPLVRVALATPAQHGPPSRRCSVKPRETLVFLRAKRRKCKMRRLLLGSAAALAALVAATPAAAQIYIGVGSSPYRYGYSPYSYGYSSYGYSPYSYGYSSYGYSPYSSYSYGYSPYSYGYSYPSYSYPSYSSYGYRTSYRSSCIHRHHRNGVVYYTRSC